MEMNTKALTILVTGTNRGLGKQLALMLLKTVTNAKLLFTTRKSPQEMQKECPQFYKNYGDRDFKFKKLQLNSEESIQKFVEQIKSQQWNFDVIVNNAAIGQDFANNEVVPDAKFAKNLLYTNVIGTIRLTNLLLPYLKSDGRVINVSSKLAALSFQTQKVREEFSDPSLEQQQIFTAVQEYIALCQEGNIGKWYTSSYGTSKMMLNAWSRFILKRKLKENQISIAMSPGHCRTDMGGPAALNSAESGAQTIYDCIFMKDPSFDIFYHRGNKYDYVECGP